MYSLFFHCLDALPSLAKEGYELTRCGKKGEFAAKVINNHKT